MRRVSLDQIKKACKLSSLQAVRQNSRLLGLIRLYIRAPVGKLGRTGDKFQILNRFMTVLSAFRVCALFNLIHKIVLLFDVLHYCGIKFTQYSMI